MSLELKMGNFSKNTQVEDEEFGSWRFILAKEEDTILLYAGAEPKGDYGYGHSNVVIENDISSEIIGGGDLCFHYGTLDISGMSGNYGIVPNSIMEQFSKLIFKEFQSKHQIKKIEIKMHYLPNQSEEANPKHCKMWNELGYEFDNKERVLEF